MGNGLEKRKVQMEGFQSTIFGWSQFILESGLGMPSNDGDHHIEGDEGDDQPADDQAGLVKGSLQALMLSLLPLPLKVHQVVGVILLLSINFCSGLLELKLQDCFNLLPKSQGMKCCFLI